MAAEVIYQGSAVHAASFGPASFLSGCKGKAGATVTTRASAHIPAICCMNVLLIDARHAVELLTIPLLHFALWLTDCLPRPWPSLSSVPLRRSYSRNPDEYGLRCKGSSPSS